MCCSPHHFADRAATHYHTRAWQTLIHRKEFLSSYSPFTVCYSDVIRPTEWNVIISSIKWWDSTDMISHHVIMPMFSGRYSNMLKETCLFRLCFRLSVPVNNFSVISVEPVLSIEGEVSCSRTQYCAPGEILTSELAIKSPVRVRLFAN